MVLVRVHDLHEFYHSVAVPDMPPLVAPWIGWVDGQVTRFSTVLSPVSSYPVCSQISSHSRAAMRALLNRVGVAWICRSLGTILLKVDQNLRKKEAVARMPSDRFNSSEGVRKLAVESGGEAQNIAFVNEIRLDMVLRAPLSVAFWVYAS